MEDEDPIDPTEELQRYLYQQLAELQASYQKQAEPIIAKLVEIESRKPPKPIIITRLLDGTISFPTSDKP